MAITAWPEIADWYARDGHDGGVSPAARLADIGIDRRPARSVAIRWRCAVPMDVLLPTSFI